MSHSNGNCVWRKKKQGFNSYMMQQIKRMINHLLKVCYFTVRNLVLLQCTDIPRGINLTPFWANLCLYDQEADFVFSVIKTDKPSAFKLTNASHFINDECNLYDSGEFDKSFH